MNLTQFSSSTHNLKIDDPFWSDYISRVREVMVPYQWEALNDRAEGAEPSRAIVNFKIAAGREHGEFYGMVFQDSDVFKWLEATSYLLETRRDSVLEAIADELIDLIVEAQREDGYLNTYFLLKEPGKEWTNLAECHELYCAGHFIEAAVAYFRATGKRKLLDAACRFADYIDTVFGTAPGKLPGYDGHQEIELALVKLYHACGDEKYLKLSGYFLDQRGRKPHFFEQEWEKRGQTIHFPHLQMVHEHEYSQSHLPVREQTTAEGHAVRLVYMCTAMADIAAETGDQEMLAACHKLWDNIVHKRMYITGGIGSMEQGESFTTDYDLPPDLAYAETCASIGLIFFARRMQRLDRNSKYADVIERALYNTVIGGMSLDGTKFFYVNPLEVDPGILGKNKNYNHIKAERQGWFTCACCPPNISRLLASLGEYIYSVQDQTVYIELYIGSRMETVIGGESICLEQDSHYAADGTSTVTVRMKAPEAAFTLALRMPDWCDEAELEIAGERLQFHSGEQDGYIRLHRVWRNGDSLSIRFAMPVRRMKSHPSVRESFGEVALQRGPFVYCLEEADNGKELYSLLLAKDARFELKEKEFLTPLAGLKSIIASGIRIQTGSDWESALYRGDSSWTSQQVRLEFIPYFAWANRGAGEMCVWVSEEQS